MAFRSLALNKTQIEEEILWFKYVCYRLQNWRPNCCFVTSWLLLALLSSHLHAISFLGWVFWGGVVWLFSFKPTLQTSMRLWCFLCCKAPLINRSSTRAIFCHFEASRPRSSSGKLEMHQYRHTDTTHRWRGHLWRATDRATRHLQPFLLPPINLVNLWLFFFFLKKNQKQLNKPNKKENPKKKNKPKTSLYIICKCVILQVAWSQGNLKAPCVTLGRWVL